MRQARSVGQTHHALDYDERVRGLWNTGVVGAAARRRLLDVRRGPDQVEELGDGRVRPESGRGHTGARRKVSADYAAERPGDGAAEVLARQV